MPECTTGCCRRKEMPAVEFRQFPSSSQVISPWATSLNRRRTHLAFGAHPWQLRRKPSWQRQRAAAAAAQGHPGDEGADGIRTSEGWVAARRQRKDWTIGPRIDLSHEDAVRMQLQALADNNKPWVDHGVEVHLQCINGTTKGLPESICGISVGFNSNAGDAPMRLWMVSQVLYRFAAFDVFQRSNYFGCG